MLHNLVGCTNMATALARGDNEGLKCELRLKIIVSMQKQYCREKSSGIQDMPSLRSGSVTTLEPDPVWLMWIYRTELSCTPELEIVIARLICRVTVTLHQVKFKINSECS
jgi:hypothetical protein